MRCAFSDFQPNWFTEIWPDTLVDIVEAAVEQHKQAMESCLHRSKGRDLLTSKEAADAALAEVWAAAGHLEAVMNNSMLRDA